MLQDRIDAMLAQYDHVIRDVEADALAETVRAYGGLIRATKGKLGESLARQLVSAAWEDVLEQNPRRLSMSAEKMRVPMLSGYPARVKEPLVRAWLEDHADDAVYKFETDVQVYVDGEMAMPIECKAYTENAMLKRILFDAMLMKRLTGLRDYYLLQLESQLGGDYSALNDVTYGSFPSHALMSYVDVDLHIVTLLEGERKVDRPIHKPGCYKPLTEAALRHALTVFTDALRPYAR